MIYLIGIILCNTYSLPTSVLVLCWIGTIVKGLEALSSFIKGVAGKEEHEK